MKITTWNVNGVRARVEQVLEWTERERPDVLCLQEIKATPEQVPAALSSLPGYWHYFHGHKGYSGVSLSLAKARFPEAPRFSHPPFDHETRIVVASASSSVGDLTLASIYVPNGNKDYGVKIRFLEALEAWVAGEHARGATLVVCGDLNVAREERDVHPSLRRDGMIGTTPEERALLERVIAHGLTDLGRRFHPDDDRLFTWWAPWRNLRERNIGWRLDYVLASAPLAERALSCASHREFGKSDHGPVQAIFDLPLPVAASEDPPTPAEAGPPAPRVGKSGQLTLKL